MFTGAFSSMNYDNSRIADLGGRKTLGMGGSLTNYINTGNASIKKSNNTDTFTLSNGSQNKKKTGIAKIAAGAAIAAAAVGGVILGIKKGGFKELGKLFSKNGSETTESFGKKFAKWRSDLKIKNLEKNADKKIKKMDLKAYKNQLAENVKKAKHDAAQKVKQYKKGS